MLARGLLLRHDGARQVLLITDGEPTAYFEGGQIEFSYPPTPRVFDLTLRQVNQCTREQIVITTFMLERAPDLIDFVARLTAMSHGRVFHTTPERLTEDIADSLPALALDGGQSP
jgi:uncharacterized protein with von Willebrand factor type A (vWA) domain